MERMFMENFTNKSLFHSLNEFEHFLDSIIEFGSLNNRESRIVIKGDKMVFYENGNICFTKEKGCQTAFALEYVSNCKGFNLQ